MAWYVKLGAQYLTEAGTWTWMKRRAKAFAEKPTGDIAPAFASLEVRPQTDARSGAAQRELEFEKHFI
jgi:hypothetical protein